MHFYCSSCFAHLGKEKYRKPCSNCGEEFIHDDCLSSGDFFLFISVEKQLVDLLINPKMHDYMTSCDLTAQTIYISDITSSSLYQQLVREQYLTENDILIWNTDSVPVFKSSTYSVWPVQCMVNELPQICSPKNSHDWAMVWPNKSTYKHIVEAFC